MIKHLIFLLDWYQVIPPAFRHFFSLKQFVTYLANFITLLFLPNFSNSDDWSSCFSCFYEIPCFHNCFYSFISIFNSPFDLFSSLYSFHISILFSRLTFTFYSLPRMHGIPTMSLLFFLVCFAIPNKHFMLLIFSVPVDQQSCLPFLLL